MKPQKALFKITLIVLATILFNQSLMASIGNLFIKNFTESEYSGHIQNWSIVQNSKGLIYVANKAQVLEYDGQEWKAIRTTKQSSTVRSLAIDPQTDVIYAGSVNEIGYVSASEKGVFEYKSLMPGLDSVYHNFTDVWKTYLIDGKVYFCSTQNIIRYCTKSEQIDTVFAPEQGSLHLSFEINNKLYMRLHDKGLHFLHNDTIKLIPGGEFYKDEGIFTVIPVDDSSFYAIGRERGIHFYNGREFIKPEYFKQVDKFILENTIYHAIKLSDGNYAFATIQGGIVICSPDGQIIQKVNIDTGLQDNTVLYLFEDMHSNLWTALYRGVSMVEYNSPWTFWDETNGLEGVVESIVKHNETLYIATSLGVFYLSDGKFNKVRNIETQTWMLLKTAKQTKADKAVLLAANLNGLYKIENNYAVPIQRFLHAYSISESPKFPGLVFVGMQDGIFAFHIKNKEILSLGFVYNFNKTARSLAQDKEGNLWVGTIVDGIHKISFPNSETYNSYQDIIRNAWATKYDEASGLPSQEELRPFFINDNILISTRQGLYLYDNHADVFIKDTTIRPFLSEPESYVSRIHLNNNENLWIGANQDFFLKKDSNLYVSNNDAFYRLPPMNIFAYYTDKQNNTWLGGSAGVFKYNHNHKKNYSKPFPTLIRAVHTAGDSLLYAGSIRHDKQPEAEYNLNYKNNSIVFSYSASFYELPDNLVFSYKLEGYDNDWSVWTKDRRKEFTNLPPGNYVFKVRAANIYQNTSIEDSFAFSIIPPWYMTIWALIGYVLLIALFVLGIIKLNSRRLKAKNKMLNRLVKERTAKLEEANKELEKLSIVARETQNAITIFNFDGKIEWTNDCFTKIYGYTLEEYIQQNGDTIFEASHNKNIKSLIEIGILNKQAVIYDYPANTKSGKEVWIQTTLTPIYNGEVLCKLVAIDTNITRLKEAEQDLIKKTKEFYEINQLLTKQKEDLQSAQDKLHSINEMLEKEKVKSDSLLLNILPAETANELKTEGKSQTRNYKSASILFTDFASFSSSADIRPFEDIIDDLDYSFAAFDDIIEKYDIEKIKTMGDSYMCVGGIPNANTSNPIEVVLAGLEMSRFITKEKKRRDLAGSPFFKMRLGIHTGELFAGVVGKKKFAYDVWGKAVNLARFMEISGQEGEVNISQDTYMFIKDYFECVSRGKIGIKHSGMVEMYLVKCLKQEYATDSDCIYPNDILLKIIQKIKSE